MFLWKNIVLIHMLDPIQYEFWFLFTILADPEPELKLIILAPAPAPAKSFGDLWLQLHNTVVDLIKDPDPLCIDPDPNPAFRFYRDPDTTVWCRSGSLPFQRGNAPKTVLFIHLYWIFLVSRSNRTHTKGTVFSTNFGHLRDFLAVVLW